MKSSLLGLESYPDQLVQEVERCFGSVTSIDVYCDGIVRINTMDNAALKAYREAYGASRRKFSINILATPSRRRDLDYW
jgi:hypothetical protein